jgi:hypothetical protein
MSNLNPDQFFHGTAHAIKDGMVRPANDVDKDISEYSFGDPGDMSEGDHAFATNDENYAWHAAHNFHSTRQRPRVYEVDPAPDMKPGPWNKDHPDFLHHVEYGDPEEYPPHENKEAYHEALQSHQPEYGSPTGFPVRKRIDIMPGRQGTFPTINWSRYATGQRGLGDRSNVNHPTDYEASTSATERTEAYKAKNAPAPKPVAKNLREYMSAPLDSMEPPPKKQPKLATLFD